MAPYKGKKVIFFIEIQQDNWLNNICVGVILQKHK